MGSFVSYDLEDPNAPVDIDFTNQTLDDRITFTRASSAWGFDATGTLTSVASGEPVFSYNPVNLVNPGIEIFGGRIEKVRNNSMAGAVVGSPGTLPTNWSITFNTVTGLSKSVVATGTDSGIPYIDIRISGTASGSGSVIVAFDIVDSQTSKARVNANQITSLAVFQKLIAGSLNGCSNPKLSLGKYDADGIFLSAFVDTGKAPTGIALNKQYYTVLATAPTTTGYGQARLQIDVTDASSIDLTLRIGAPSWQVSNDGGSLTSSRLVVTTGNEITFAAESISLLLSSTNIPANPTGLTVVGKITVPTGASISSPGFVYQFLNTGSINNYILGRYATAGLQNIVGKIVNSTGVNWSITDSLPTGSTCAFWAGMSAGDLTMQIIGNSILSSYSFSSSEADTVQLPTGLNKVGIGCNPTGSSQLGGIIERLMFFNKRLTDSEARTWAEAL